MNPNIDLCHDISVSVQYLKELGTEMYRIMVVRAVLLPISFGWPVTDSDGLEHAYE